MESALFGTILLEFTIYTFLKPTQKHKHFSKYPFAFDLTFPRRKLPPLSVEMKTTTCKQKDDVQKVAEISIYNTQNQTTLSGPLTFTKVI